MTNLPTQGREDAVTRGAKALMDLEYPESTRETTNERFDKDYVLSKCRKKVQVVLDAAYPQQEPFPGKPGEHCWIAHGLDPYHAVNLREALKLVQDTGDWHGSLRAACHIALRDHPEMKPNVAAGDQKPPAYPQQTEGDEQSVGAWETQAVRTAHALIAAEQRAQKAERERDDLDIRLDTARKERREFKADRDRLQRECERLRGVLN